MISATKGPAPRCLTTLAATPGADWDGSVYGDQRKEIREHLARDQGSLCAYCQRRARASDREIRIDHWHPRTAGGPHFQWSNLVGSCTHRGACDDHKGETPLFLHPFRGHGPDPREFLRYTGAGEVRADDPRAAADIETLNLNDDRLRRARRAALDALIADLRTAGFTPGALRARLRDLEDRRGESIEYAEALAHDVRRRLRRHES